MVQNLNRIHNLLWLANPKDELLDREFYTEQAKRLSMCQNYAQVFDTLNEMEFQFPTEGDARKMEALQDLICYILGIEGP